MGYCFMTFEKIKTKASMSMKYEHNYRVMDVENADKSLAHLNDELVSLNGRTYTEAFEEKINSLGYYSGENAGKIRKNAVLALEVVTTFSREDREKIDLEEWKKDNIEWLRQAFNANPKKYGDNVLSVMYHGDENGNVHCHAFVVPIDNEGKLNSSYYIDGRQKIIALQDSYGKIMKEKHDLNRGLKGSHARHQDIKKFYTALNMEISKELPKINENESPDEYRQRISELYQEQNLKIMGLENKLKRKELEEKTHNIDEKIDFYKMRDEIEKLKYENEKLKNMLNTLGDTESAMAIIDAFNDLNRGIQAYPDREVAIETYQNVQKLIEFARSDNPDHNIENEK